jgi:ketosteroid isomerase-like protein
MVSSDWKAKMEIPSHGTPADPDVRTTLEHLFAAWSDLDPAQAAPFYAKDPDLVFFDVAPMKYTGWAEIAAETPKTFADYRSLKLMCADDLRVHRAGDLAWATAILLGDLTRKDGGIEHFEIRYTTVLEKRGNAWLVVHEHLSAPQTGALKKVTSADSR